MTDDDKTRLQCHEIVRKSLREVLVPYPQWKERVYSVENSITDIAHFTELKTGLNNMFMVEYPYKVSALDVYLAEKYGADSSKQRRLIVSDGLSLMDRAAINAAFTYRVQHFIRYMMSDALVSLIDNDYDTGVFIHRNSGAIVPFKYNELKSVSCYSMYNAIQRFILTKSMTNLAKFGIGYAPSNVELSQLRRMHQHPEELSAMYVLEFGDKNTYYKESHIEQTITYGGSITAEDVNTTVRYMESMLHAHAKCIIVL